MSNWWFWTDKVLFWTTNLLGAYSSLTITQALTILSVNFRRSYLTRFVSWKSVYFFKIWLPADVSFKASAILASEIGPRAIIGAHCLHITIMSALEKMPLLGAFDDCGIQTDSSLSPASAGSNRRFTLSTAVSSSIGSAVLSETVELLPSAYHTLFGFQFLVVSDFFLSFHVRLA